MFSALSVVTPPASEPISVALMKQHTRIDNDADDALVAIYITAARTWAEEILGRALVSQQLLWTIAQQQPPNGYPYLSMPLTLFVLPQWLSYGLLQNRCNGIELPRQPVISVDAVSYGTWGAADTVLVADTDYYVDIASARLQIQPGSEVIPNDHLSITFTTGYAVTGNTVPQPIVHAIMLMAAFLFEHRGDAGGDPPSAAAMLMAPYRLTTFG